MDFEPNPVAQTTEDRREGVVGRESVRRDISDSVLYK